MIYYYLCIYNHEEGMLIRYKLYLIYIVQIVFLLSFVIFTLIYFYYIIKYDEVKNSFHIF